MAATDTTAVAADYAALTERCGLVDRSERGKLALTGSGAVEFLNGQVTNELAGLAPGEGCYAAFLTHKGKMLGDLRILVATGSEGSSPPGSEGGSPAGPSEAREAENVRPPLELLLDTERASLQALFDMIRRFKVGYEVVLHKRTLECSLLSLIGPDADAVATKAFTADPVTGHGPTDLPKREDGHVLVRLGETPARLIRTNVGIDALLDFDALAETRTALETAGGAWVSETAAEIVRVEHGRPRYGIDLDESTIPQEAGLNERAVSFTKGCYVGQETVARLHYKGKPNRHLRGLRLSEPVEAGAGLRLGERSVGQLTSSVVSPAFGPIGLALLRREAEPGATLTVEEGGATGLAQPSALVSELPFA